MGPYFRARRGNAASLGRYFYHCCVSTHVFSESHHNQVQCTCPHPFDWEALSAQPFTLGSSYGCWQPLVWTLGTYCKASFRKPRHVLLLGVSHCVQQLCLFCCAYHGLWARFIQAITLKCRSVLCSRSHHRVSVCVCFETILDLVLRACSSRSVLTSTIFWCFSLSSADVAFVICGINVRFQLQVLGVGSLHE